MANSDERMTIRLDGMSCGWIFIQGAKGNQVVYMQFDECLTDEIPLFIRMCQQIQQGEDFCYHRENLVDHCSSELVFEAHQLDHNLVEFSITGEITERYMGTGDECPDDDMACEDEYYEFPQGTLTDIFTREELVGMFRRIFDDMLQDMNFPWQFPCFSQLDDDEYGQACDEAMARCERVYDDFNVELQLLEEQLVFSNVHIMLVSEAYYLTYKRMLETMIIPEGWSV